MGSPITLSGFNQIDFSVILNAIMQQERQPVTALQSQQTSLEGKKAAFSALVSKLSALQSSVESVVADNALSGTSATVSDSTRLSVSSETSAASGTYEVTVQQLARAQTTTSDQAFADRDTTAVAGAGMLGLTAPSLDSRRACGPAAFSSPPNLAPALTPLPANQPRFISKA